MQQNEPTLVSVIIPFYNSEGFLAETIDSVLNQEYMNWEIILVDDGSTDNSSGIALNYASRYPNKVFYFHHEQKMNKGAAASRNLGVSKAKGELLAFLDSDDLWLPAKLDVQVAFMIQNPEVSVICEATKYWYSWHNPKAKDKIIPIGAPVGTVYNPPQLAALLYPLGTGDSFCTCALMMRTHAFRTLGGFDESFTGTKQLFEDQVLFLKICLNETVFLSASCNNIYRQRPNSLMHGSIAKGHYAPAHHYFLQWLKQYLHQKNIIDPNINKLLKQALFPYKYPTIAFMNDASRAMKQKLVRKLKGALKRK